MSATADSSEGASADRQELPTSSAAAASAEWTPAEEASLASALLVYTPDKYPTSLERCILIAAQLPTRSAREVALRISQLAQQQAAQQGALLASSRLAAAELKRRTSAQLPTQPGTVKTAAATRTASRAGGSKQPGKAPTAASAPQVAAAAALPAGIIPPPPPPLAVPQAPNPPGLELQEIPPPGPQQLLPSLSASCFYQQPSPPSTCNSGEDATCTVHPGNLTTTTAAEHGTSGSADTTFGNAVASATMAAVHQPSSATAAMSGISSSEQSVIAAVQNLMEQNYAILNSFKTNMQQCKVMENTELLVRFRDNVIACLNHMNTELLQGGPGASMPPLPVQPNLDLANKFLPPKVPPMSPMGMGIPPFPFNPTMGPIPGMAPLMFPPMGAPPGMMPPGMMPGMPSQPGMPPMAPMPGLAPMPGMPPFPMPGMPGMPAPHGMPAPVASPLDPTAVGGPGGMPIARPPGPMVRPMGLPMPGLMPPAGLMVPPLPMPTPIMPPGVPAPSPVTPAGPIIKQEGAG